MRFNFGHSAAGIGISLPISVANGGTGASSFTDPGYVYYDGTKLASANFQQESGTGHFVAITDNTYDIGKTTGLRPRSIIASQAIIAGTHIRPTGSGRSRMSSPADGKMLFEDAVGSGTFTLFQLGGTTSAFPALKRASDNIECRLADDSNYAAFAARRLAVAAGTLTTDQKCVDVSCTFNAGGVTFTGIKFAATDTASASNSKLLELLAGAGGATSMFSVRRDGKISGGTRTITVSFSLPTDGDVSVPIVIPYSGVITGWAILTENETADVELDIWKDTTLPTSADSIVAAAPPTGSGVEISSTLTGWTTAITANDVLRVECTTTSDASVIVLHLFIKEQW